MGGSRSGRYVKHSCTYVENCQRLSISRLKNGLSQLLKGKEWYIDWETRGAVTKTTKVTLVNGALKVESDGLTVPIDLTTTQPNFGGVRYWFICPYCGKRVGTLYQTGFSFVCRNCIGLRYKLEYRNKLERLDIKRKRLKSELKENPFVKPKGMHSTTYARDRKSVV